MEVPVQDREELIGYESVTARDADPTDVERMRGGLPE